MVNSDTYTIPGHLDEVIESYIKNPFRVPKEIRLCENKFGLIVDNECITDISNLLLKDPTFYINILSNTYKNTIGEYSVRDSEEMFYRIGANWFYGAILGLFSEDIEKDIKKIMSHFVYGEYIIKSLDSDSLRNIKTMSKIAIIASAIYRISISSDERENETYTNRNYHIIGAFLTGVADILKLKDVYRHPKSFLKEAKKYLSGILNCLYSLPTECVFLLDRLIERQKRNYDITSKQYYKEMEDIKNILMG